jgi:hypothetical protein
VRICGYFSNSEGVREQKSLGRHCYSANKWTGILWVQHSVQLSPPRVPSSGDFASVPVVSHVSTVSVCVFANSCFGVGFPSDGMKCNKFRANPGTIEMPADCSMISNRNWPPAMPLELLCSWDVVTAVRPPPTRGRGQCLDIRKQVQPAPELTQRPAQCCTLEERGGMYLTSIGHCAGPVPTTPNTFPRDLSSCYPSQGCGVGVGRNFRWSRSR